MMLFANQPWGNAQIKYFPGQYPQKEVQKAAKAVTPDFDAPSDTLVLLDKEGRHTIAQVPSSTEEHHIFTANGTDAPALVSVLTQTRDFLKNHPLKKTLSLGDLRHLLPWGKDKPAT